MAPLCDCKASGTFFGMGEVKADQPVVLLAEDNEHDVAMLQRAFSLAGIVAPLHVVENGEEAIAYLSGEGKYIRRDEFPLPDLLLVDLKMPRKDGFDVIEWVRGHPEFAALRVVVLTTSDCIRDVNRAYQLGANSFLTKPIVFRDFKDTIQAMCTYWLELSRAPKVSRPPLVNPLLKH
jgi:CheY-like chemotaxis protein